MSLGEREARRRQGGEGGSACDWSSSELVEDRKEEGSGKHMRPSGKGDVKSFEMASIFRGWDGMVAVRGATEDKVTHGHICHSVAWRTWEV